MLSNLASYLMGGAPTVPAAASAGPSATPSTVPTEVAQGTVIAHQELRCTEEEDWLLVDPDASTESSCGSTAESSSREGELPSGSQGSTAPICIRRLSEDSGWFGPTNGEDAEDTQHRSSRGRNRSSNGPDDELRSHQMDAQRSGGTEGSPGSGDAEDGEDNENCAPSSGLEESWYVAPSACIARRRPVKLATSPLENLLIEHPSMSVYHHSVSVDAMHSPSASPVAIEEADEHEANPSADEEMMEMAGQIRPVSGKRTRRPFVPSTSSKDKKQFRGHHTSAAAAASSAAGSNRKQDLMAPCTATPTVPHLKSQKVALEVAMLGGRVSQKKDRTNRSQLDRLNKCRSASNQKKLRRSDRQNSNKNSFVNNNRKSSYQRMF